MNILIVTQYFWPESFRINDIAADLAERGHNVTVLTGKPNYPIGSFYEGYSFFSKSSEIWKNIRIIRSPIIKRGDGSPFRLFLNYLSFAFFASLKITIIKGKIDKIFVYEPSPITVGFPAIFAKRKFKAPIFFWILDLWPESITAADGITNKNIISIAGRLTNYIYRNCYKLLVQSKGFIPYLLNQDIALSKLIYFPNPAENFYKVVSKSDSYLKKLPDGYKIMFAGNIGKGQSFETLLKASKILKDENIQINWIILGDGRMKEWVQNQISILGLNDCFFLNGSYPAEEMPYFFACADALVVSLKRNPVFALTIPAKVQSYLACGRPILGSIDGEGAKIIEEAGAGLCSPAEDADAFANVIKEFYFLDKEKRNEMGINGRKYFEKEFERRQLIDKLEVILNS